MAQDRTSNFDMLVQISETEINNQIALGFLAGDIIPSSMSVPVNVGGATGSLDLIFQTPVADFDRPRPRMGIAIPFTNSQLQITSPISRIYAPLGGTITIVDALEVITDGGNQIVTLDFNNGAPVVTVLFNDGLAALPTLLNDTGLSLDQLSNLMAGMVLAELQNSVRRIDIAVIEVFDDTDPTTIFALDVTTINDTTVADRDCIAFGLKTASDSGGNINGVTTNFIPAGSNSMVMLSNFWLLARAMRPRVATALGLAITDFDTPLHLNSRQPAPGGVGRLTNLDARIEGNRIRVDGRITHSGTGFSAVATFNFFITISIDASGTLNIANSEPDVNTDVDLEWWVWLLSLGLGGLFGGIIGAIVIAINLAIVEAVVESLADSFIANSITTSFGSIPPIPLGPVGAGISIDNVILDDLELRSTIIRKDVIPIKNRGTFQSISGFSIDLDNGNTSSAILTSSDLIWNPSRGLQATSSVGLTVTGSGYASLGVVQISRMPLNSILIPLGSIPLTTPPGSALFPHNEVVFGLRTNEGRYAKLKAWRNILDHTKLNLSWTTFDTPHAELIINSRWQIIEKGEETNYITDNCEYCTKNLVAWLGVFEAWPKLMVFPINYQWCLCGQIIKEGEGEVSSANGPIAYKLTGRRLTIKSSLGQNINCQLCVSAIDQRGHEIFKCIKLNKSGISIKCKKCEPKKKGTYTFIPIDRHLASWRTLPLEKIKIDK